MTCMEILIRVLLDARSYFQGIIAFEWLDEIIAYSAIGSPNIRPFFFKVMKTMKQRKQKYTMWQNSGSATKLPDVGNR